MLNIIIYNYHKFIIYKLKRFYTIFSERISFKTESFNADVINKISTRKRFDIHSWPYYFS